MKYVKKFVSILLALVMAFALAVPAFAEDDEETTNSYSYEIYQIFTGDYHNGILSNVKWGQNAKIPDAAEGETQAKVGDAVPESVLTELTAVTSSTSDAEKLAVITEYTDLNSNALNVTPTVNSETGAVTYSGLDNGYYLVKDADNSVTGNDVYTTYVVQVVDGTLTFTRKGNVPTSEKKIVDDGKKLDANEASIGDTVSYEITGTLPSNIADYKEYYYVFTDTLSKGLTYTEDSIKVVVVNDEIETDVTGYFYKGAVTDSNSGVTTITVGIQDLKALAIDDQDENKVLPVTINKDSKIVVTYSAVLNTDAVIAGDGNTNDVVLAYSNDPNNSGDGTTEPPDTPEKPDPTHPTGVTPKSTVKTYTTELTILKNDEKQQTLTGAEFTLSGVGVNIVLVTTETFTADENGEYYKLANGTYTTTAPTDLYESLTTKYSYDKTTDEYTVDENGTYWKLKTAEGEKAEYTETDPDTVYDSTSQKYTKGITVTPKEKDQANSSVVGTIDEGGHVTFTGLGAGSYKISETVTPAGYNTIAPITFTLTFDTVSLKFMSDNTDVIVGQDNKLDATIVNKSGAELPTTGGTGTKVFYVVGGILTVGAIVLLVAKKRMDSEK